MGIKVNKWADSIHERKKTEFMFVEIYIQINCKAAYVKNELMVVTKKIANFNVISFTWMKLLL